MSNARIKQFVREAVEGGYLPEELAGVSKKKLTIDFTEFRIRWSLQITPVHKVSLIESSIAGAHMRAEERKERRKKIGKDFNVNPRRVILTGGETFHIMKSKAEKIKA